MYWADRPYPRRDRQATQTTRRPTGTESGRRSFAETPCARPKASSGSGFSRNWWTRAARLWSWPTKARYALVVIGVLNAGVFFIISRGHLLADLPQSIKPWLVGLVVIYSALTFIFMYYAVECLRPRRMPYLGVMVANDGIDTPAALHGPRGILFWETIAKYELDAYRRAWASVRMEQLNAEVVVIAHQQARLIRSKYAALQWLFRGLAVLLVLAGVLLAVYAAFGLAG